MVDIPGSYSAYSIRNYLLKPYIWAPGSLDVRQRPALFFPDIDDGIVTFTNLDLLLDYFFHSNFYRHVLVIDRRKSGWISIKKLLIHLNLNYIDQIEYTIVLRPQGFFQRLTSDKVVIEISNILSFPLHVIDEPKELFKYISSNQIPRQFGGDLLFNVPSWVNFQIEIEAFQQTATELGREIQNFVGDIPRLESLACVTRDFTEFKLDWNPVEALQRRRRRLLHRLSSCESRGVDLRKRLREVDTGISVHSTSSEEAEDDDDNDESKKKVISSLDLPVDRSTQIIFVEQYIIQLTETRSKLRRIWHRFTRGLKNLKTLDDFECRYKKLYPLLGAWQSLVESVPDYLPGRSGAPHLLLPQSSASVCDGSLRGLSDASEETDSAVVMEEGGYSESSSVAAATSVSEDSMEGLLAIRARAKDAQASGVALLKEILDLINLGEYIRDRIVDHVSSGSSDCGGPSDCGMSTFSFNGLLAHLTLDSHQIDPLMDSLEEEESGECGWSEDDEENAYESEDSDALSVDMAETKERRDSECSSPSSLLPFLACQIPEYSEMRIASLRQLETLAHTGLSNAVSQLDRLVQFYTEINEARQWISRGNSLLNPLTTERIMEMDPVTCEETIKQLSSFCDTKEQNLVLKGNPGQFRRQFSSLLNAEMKVELSQMLRLVEEVEQALKLTVANLRQQISRNTFPIKAPTSCQHTHHHQPHQMQLQQYEPLALQNLVAPSVCKQTFLNVEQASPDDEMLEQPPVADLSKSSDAKLYQRALEELIITEANHIKFLEAATRAFSENPGDPTLPRLPAFVRENRTLFVVNLPEQLAFHKNYFYPQLLACGGDPLLIQQWAESSWASLVDLYTNYCLNYERATHYVAAFERDRIHSQWISAYNRYLNSLEVEETGKGLNGRRIIEKDDLREAASLNRANSCITFDNQTSSDISEGSETGVGEPAKEGNEENLPPSRKNSQGMSIKSASLCRPLLSYSSRLLEPAQRFQRYHLLIDRLKKYAPEGPQKQALTKAHQSMLDMCDTVNVLMRIRGLTDRPSRLGRLLLQDNFTVWCGDSRNGKHQRYVFLFENAILLTKLRQPNNSLVSTVLATLGSGSSVVSNSQSPPTLTSTDSGTTAIEEAGESSSSVGGGEAEINSLPSALPSIPPDVSSQKPTYEIKMELKLVEVGLTPNVREDRRRFAVWTACRAQTYVFQPNNLQVRTQWVRAINDLLSAQLKRLRENVHRQHNLITHASSSLSSTTCCQDHTDTLRNDFDDELDEDGDVTVTDF